MKISRKIYLIDSPGIIPMRDPTKLVLIGSYDPNKMEDPELAAEILLRILHSADPEKWPQNIDEYAQKKGYLRKGGVPDTHRAAVELLSKWQRGKITLPSKDWLERVEQEFENVESKTKSPGGRE